MTDFRKELNITLASPYFEEAYRQALAEKEIPAWLTEDHLCELNEKYHALSTTYEMAREALPHVVAVPELCLLAKTLYYILASRVGFSKAFGALTLPEAPKDSPHALGYDTVALFPVLAHVKLTCEELLSRGVDPDIVSASVRWTNNFFKADSKICGKPCYSLNSFSVYGVGIYVNSFIIGPLRFEMAESVERPVRIFRNEATGALLPLMENTLIHESGHIFGTYGCEDEKETYAADFVETEDAYEGYTVDEKTRLVVKRRVILSKKEWTQVFVSGMPAVKVHIPGGKKMLPQLVEESYERAREMFARCYPEYSFSCFLIVCWMLSPVLKEILPPTSNIVSFASDFTVFPFKNNALDAFLYVFNIKGKQPFEIDLASLPEDNSLQRGIKQRALAGELVYQFGGYKPRK